MMMQQQVAGPNHAEMLRRHREVRLRLERAAKSRWRAPRIVLISDWSMPVVVKQPTDHAVGLLGPLARILLEVAEKHSTPPEVITGPARLAKIMPARFEFYYRAASETTASLPQIGRRCGGRDHTTVLAGLRAYCRRTGEPLPRGIPEFRKTRR